MKKILLLISVLGLMLTACSDGIPERIKDKAPSLKEITQVKPSYVVELIEAKESFIFYFSNTWCSACEFMKDVNNEVVRRESLPMYVIQVDKTSVTQLNKIYAYVTQPAATPTYVIVLNGVVKESFTPEILVGDDTGFDPEHINLYVVNFIAVLKTKGLITP